MTKHQLLAPQGESQMSLHGPGQPAMRATTFSAMRALQLDHVNFTRLLDMLDRQLDAVVRMDGSANYDLMQDIMLYMTHYPDKFHHPKEDLIFTRLVARDASARPVIDQLMKEHKVLAEKGTIFRETLRAVSDGELVRRATIESQGRDYVASLRAHASTEESRVFPLAESQLFVGDWAAIEDEIEHMEDPLFGQVVADDYRALYEFIMRESK